MKNINQYRNIIIVIIIVIGAIFVSRNIYNDFINQENDIEQRTENLEEGKVTVERWKKEISEYKKLKEEFFQGNLLDVKKFIEDAAQSTGIAINSLRQSENQTNYFQIGEFHLDTNCTYQQLTDFIRLLEEKSIEIINLSIDQASRNQEQLSAGISIKGVVLK